MGNGMSPFASAGVDETTWDGMILGIDEAGRGPVLGPMVVAGVVLRPQKAGALTRRGVTDSKEFGAGAEARQKRAELAEHIRRLAEDIRVEVFDHREVDRYTADGRLNELERRGARSIIDGTQEVKRIVADGARVFGPLRYRYVHLEARDHGESVHVAVAAASIIAKDLRDRLFEEIAERYRDEFGEIRGGGYVNAATARFLRRYHQRYQKLPPETRRSWGWELLRELEPLPLPLFDAAGAAGDASS
jgi:ribonuclease HII